MLVIDTKLTPPEKEFLSQETEKGNCVWHVPALECRPTGIRLEISEFDAVFIASPRAAKLAKDALSKFEGPVLAAGPGTARVLLQMGIPVADAGSGNGAEKDFPQFLKMRKIHRIAWISAKQTAADIGAIARENTIAIEHLPIYETFPAQVDEMKMQSIEHPVEWHFYSGKGVLSLKRFVQSNDVVHLHGDSAEKAFLAFCR